MDRASLIFCTLSLVVSVGLAWLLYPVAAVPGETLARWIQPAAPDAVPDVNLGDFGTVSVNALMGYYIENPPAAGAASAPTARAVHFQGC